VCSSCSCPSAAPCAAARAWLSARRVAKRSSDFILPSASAADRPGRGPFDAAPNARAAGWRSPAPAPRSCTTAMHACSSGSGRSTDGGVSRNRQLRSSPRSSSLPRQRRSHSCRVTPSELCAAVTWHRGGSRKRWVASGACLYSSSSAGHAHCLANEVCRSPSGVATLAGRWSPSTHRRVASRWWTTCTRPEPRRTPVRRL
jgi:hypothetical protein